MNFKNDSVKDLYMKEKNHLEKWVSVLKQRELDNLVATIFESTKPLNFIFAQLVYIGKPLFNGHFASEPISAFANLLEDDIQMDYFIASLREEN
jgi:hypothetical protein